MSLATFACPHCDAQLSIEQLFAQAQDMRALHHLALISVPVGAKVLNYLRLFAAPGKQLRAPRLVRLIEQLLPDLQRQAITLKGRDWDVPLQAWALGLEAMLQQRDTGALKLPLNSHGYLYAVLQGMAEKVERTDEARRDRDRRERPRTDTRPSMDLAAVLRSVHTPPAAPAARTHHVADVPSAE